MAITLSSALEWASAGLADRSGDVAKLEAEVLLAHVLKTDRAALFAHPEREISPSEIDTFRNLVAIRITGRPVAYLVGEREFYSHMFYVDPAVLIPRPSTEHLVEAVISYVECFSKEFSLCDVGTGSGAVAVTLKKHLPRARVTALDISRDALRVARMNSMRHGVDIDFVQGDLFSAVAPDGFDVVVANLPYVPTEMIDGLSEDVRQEPKEALDGGADGLDLVRRLASGMVAGRLFLEIGFSQLPAVQTFLSDEGYEDIDVRRDLSGIPRVISGTRKGSCH